MSDNWANTVTLLPAFARGVTPGTALRGLIELATKTNEGSHDDVAVRRWLANATVSLLAQIAVTDATTSQKILADAAAVARSQRTTRGLESILLSSLLGSPAAATEEALLAEVWERFAEPDSASMYPIVDPVADRLTFLSAAHLVNAASRHSLRAGLLDQLDDAEDEEFTDSATSEVAVELAAAVMTAASAMATTSPLADGPTGQALPEYLANGKSYLVEVILTAASEPPYTGPEVPGVVAPELPVATSEHAEGEAAHPFWKSSFRCAAMVLAGPLRHRLLLRRGTRLTLSSLPKLTARNELASPGFLPARTARPATPGDTDSPQRTRRRTQPARQRTRNSLVAVPIQTDRRARLTPKSSAIPPENRADWIAYAPVLDGLGVDAYIPMYPPGFEPPTVAGAPSPIPGSVVPHPASAIEMLTRSVRALELSPDSTINDVVRAMASSRYGATLNLLLDQQQRTIGG